MPVWVDNGYRMTRNSGAGYLYEHKAGNLTKNGCVCTNIATLPYTTHNAYNFRFFMRFRNFGGGRSLGAVFSKKSTFLYAAWGCGGDGDSGQLSFTHSSQGAPPGM